MQRACTRLLNMPEGNVQNTKWGQAQGGSVIIAGVYITMLNVLLFIPPTLFSCEGVCTFVPPHKKQTFSVYFQALRQGISVVQAKLIQEVWPLCRSTIVRAFDKADVWAALAFVGVKGIYEIRNIVRIEPTRKSCYVFDQFQK